MKRAEERRNFRENLPKEKEREREISRSEEASKLKSKKAMSLRKEPNTQRVLEMKMELG